ncbi:hypothetical protein [Marinilactibacillus psychrotolerans]|uniref:hypothetical protein n=1 Tax=Marinilactibacillus psychrotolerans TaxID=191770 RepID=UPI00388AC92C
MVDNYKEELIEYIKAKKEYEEIENQYNVLIKYKLAQEQIEIIISEEKLKTVSKAHHLINQELEDLDKKFDSISKKYYKLRYELNPDNLRNVMYHLMTNEKLTESELAEEISYTITEVNELFERGSTTSRMLDMLCKKFDVPRLTSWDRYVNNFGQLKDQ